MKLLQGRHVLNVVLIVTTTGMVLMPTLGHAPVPALAGSPLTWNTGVTVGPVALARPATALGQDGNIYVFGGIGGDGSQFSTTFIYEPQTNTWSTGADMPVAREGAQAVTLPDGRIAILGGAIDCSFNNLCSAGTVYNRVDVYDPVSNTWGSLAPMLSPRYRFAAALYHGHIYAIGGSDGTQTLSSVEVYDPSSNSWSSAPDLPQAEEAPAAAVDSTDHLDVFGGFDDPQTFPQPSLDSFYMYDGNSWNTGPALPQATEDENAVIGADGQVYVIGGFNLTDWLDTVQVYNPRTQGWSFVSSLSTKTCCAGAVTVPGGQIFLVTGGNNAGNSAATSAGSQVAVYGPQITVSPTIGLAGSSATISGTNFAPGSTASLYWGDPSSGTLLGTGAVDGTGDLTAPVSITIPATATTGSNTITAVDDQSEYPVTTTFVVPGSTASASTLSMSSGSYGTRIAIGGANFKPGAPIYLFWDRAFAHPLAATLATAQGSFTMRFIVPQVPTGRHSVLAWQPSSRAWTLNSVQVVPRIALSRAVSSGGSSDVLSGYGFGANETVRVYWNNPLTGGSLLGSATTNGLGTFAATTALTFTVPSSGSGLYNLLGQGSSRGGITILVVKS